ncbi:MAG: hypothetical protein NVS1B16_12540 [Pseudarthrobacter sp.]
MSEPITLVALTGPKDDRTAAVALRVLEPADLHELRRAQEHAYADADGQPIEVTGAELHSQAIGPASLVTSGPDGQITGAIVITDQDGSAVITELFTHPDHRRQGLAEELLREALHVLHTRDHHTVTVSVEENNSAALALYLSRDFRRLVDDGDEADD